MNGHAPIPTQAPLVVTVYTNTIDDLVRSSELNVPRSTSYNVSRNLDNSGENKVPDWSTYAAIYNGMLATNMSHLSAPCTTGNCTWPITPSLGVCGECRSLRWSAPENCTGSTYDPSGDQSCIYTLPDNQTLRVGKGDYVNIFQVSLSDGVAYNASSTTIPYILNIEAIGMPYGAPAWDATLISAQECALWYCIQAYNTSVTSNQQDQKTVETWSQVTFPPDPEGADINGTITFTVIPSSMNVNRGVSYSVGVNSWHGAQAGFQNIFSQGVIQAGSGGTFNRSVWIDALWAGWGNNSDMSHLISTVALSMANNIQQTSPVTTPESRYFGTAYRERLLVQVRWEWLSPPVALVLFSVVFLVVIILKTRSVGLMAWKGSALALLFSGVDEELKENSKNGLSKPDGLAKATSQSRVALREKDGLWEFENLGH
ncbi:hypothetical protein IFR04_009056 [Cadophora malorum]|uniref:Uncharacterized protein n=1 Tax=Cadophora malorum TaxID=108018 RepID=A0A8H7TFA6_9HELO|nr:hypothetical protein IFR04_009056 [Cadophora malorum]